MGKLIRAVTAHPLIDTLIHLKGNERACLLTEPLWGIPYNLYVPYVSVYMAALGMTPFQIGIVSTAFFASQMFWALFGGALTDKLGRRFCTLIFDFLCWSVPALLWMCAQNFYWFLAAALLNGMWRITETSWALLLVEEAPESRLVHLYSITHIAGLLAGFVAPIPYFFVQTYSVIPTVRVLYGLTFILMTAKFLILYFLSHETEIGLRHMKECKNINVIAHAWDGRHVLFTMLKTPKVMLTVGVVGCFAAIKSVNDAFWPLLITDKLGIATENLSVFATVRSLMMLLAFFVWGPRISVYSFKKPLMLGFSCLGLVYLMLLFIGPGASFFVMLGVVAEALALSVLNPLTSSLQMLHVDKEERARMNGLFCAMCLLMTSPFGALAGYLSEMNRAWPYVLNLGLVAVALFLSVRVWNMKAAEEAVAA